MLKRVVAAIAGLAVAAAAAFAVFVWASQEETSAARPDIPFAAKVDNEIADPDNPTKVFHVDFARVEHEAPLARADLMKLTPANLLTFDQEEIDQIYGRLTAGPIPDGFYEGDLFFPRVEDGAEASLKPRIEEILGGIGGRIAGEKIERLEKVGRSIWKGKRFNREQRTLRNAIEDLAALRPLIESEATIETIKVPREGWLSYILPTTEAWLLFPAKLYCGQSLLDGRRESVIIDYAYSDEVPGYRAKPDNLAGRGGLRIRDEIRMIRPGFYLGRAYANRMFLLNFVLYNPEVANDGAEAFRSGGTIAEDCWPGEQARKTASQ